MNKLPAHCQPTIQEKWRTYLESPDPSQASYLARVAMRHDHMRVGALTISHGNYSDALYLLDQGFHEVHALDLATGSPKARSEVEERFGARFCYGQADIESLDFSLAGYDAIISNHGIACHGQEGFADLFESVKASVRANGVLAVTLYGEKEQWIESHHGFAMFTAREVFDLFDGFKIRLMRERRPYDGHFVDGTPKRRHYFEVVAQKSLDDEL